MAKINSSVKIFYVLLVLLSFFLGFLVSRFIPVCGNGMREFGENLSTCLADCGGKIYPSATDATVCSDTNGKIYPAVGAGAATWFFYGCGEEKVYQVRPYAPVALVVTGDERQHSDSKFPVFGIWEKYDGKWWLMETVKSQKNWPRKVSIIYTPKSDAVKIKTHKFLYLDVYADNNTFVHPFLSYWEKLKKLLATISFSGRDTFIEYVNPKFKYRIRRYKDMKVVVSSGKDVVAFFDPVYGRNPLDADRKIPVVSVRVSKCGGAAAGDCRNASVSPCDGLRFGQIGDSRETGFDRMKYSWPSSQRKVSESPATLGEIQCNRESYQGLAVVKDDMIYVTMFLSGSEKYISLPVEKGVAVLDSFDFMEASR